MLTLLFRIASWLLDGALFRLERFSLRVDFTEYDRTGLLDAGPISKPESP